MKKLKADNLVENELKLIQSKKKDPNNIQVLFDLGFIQNKLSKFLEAEKNFITILKFNKKNPRVYFNLALSQQKQGNFHKAEQNYLKAIELNPNYLLAYYNLAIVQNELNKLEEAIMNNENVLKIDPNYVSASHNLNFIKRVLELLKKIENAKSFTKLKSITNPVISERQVDNKLIEYLSSLNFPTIKDTFSGPLYGNGFTSSYQLFNIDHKVINSIKTDLTSLIHDLLGSKIFIMDSFYNILNTDSGSKIHDHIGDFDIRNNLIERKFSLVYYLSVGDQNCSKPGILKLYDPEEEILPKDGMILIWPAKRLHSSSYNGKKNRLMLGLNFYLVE